MSNKKKLEKLKELRAQVRSFKDTNDHYYQLFAEDGNIDEYEQAQLDKIAGMISKIETELDKREDELGFFAKVKNSFSELGENIKDGLSKKDDEPDHSLVDPREEDNDTNNGSDDGTNDTNDQNGSNDGTNDSSNDDTNDQNNTNDGTNDDTNDGSNDGSDDNSDDSTNTGPVGSVIKDSVGKDGNNDKNDVLIVQKLLKDTWGYDVNQEGTVDDKVIQAILKFQHRYAGMIRKQDGRIDAGGTTWSYLCGDKNPELGKQDDGTLAGAETETEKKLAEFAESVGEIQIEVSPGELIGVRPPYHQNNSRQAVVEAERAKNPAVNKIISKMGWNDEHGKATPGAIKKFLEDCIAKSLIKDKSSTGLNQFLDKFGISLDCSGLAIQAVNFLKDGNLDREKSDAVQITNAKNIMNYGTKISAPKDLVAGDMMVNKGHVRVIIDVDINGEEVAFTTVESGASVDLGYGGGSGHDGGDGVGERRWRFSQKSKFEKCERLKGNVWASDGNDYVYRRIDDAAIKRINAL